MEILDQIGERVTRGVRKGCGQINLEQKGREPWEPLKFQLVRQLPPPGDSLKCKSGLCGSQHKVFKIVCLPLDHVETLYA